MVSTKQRRAKKVDPFASVPGENGPARYNRLYAKGKAEGVLIERNQYGIPFALSADMVTWYDFTCADNGEYVACSCPYGGSEPGRLCKHLAVFYPPQPYRDPCPLCSGPMVHRQEGTEHAVRCLHCHYVEQWQDKQEETYNRAIDALAAKEILLDAPVLANGSKGAALDYEEMYT